jgi:hypothetical protein
MNIPKYRKEGNDQEWWITNFTAEQVEGRLTDLEKQNEEYRKEIKRLREPDNDFHLLR